MTRQLSVYLTAIALGAFALSGCGDPDPVDDMPPDRPSLPDMGSTSNNTTPEDMGTEPEDMGPEDMGPGDMGCMPKTCEGLGMDAGDDVCGMQDDGCGAMIDCGGCGCDPADPVGSCPSAPCQVASGCVMPGGECAYEPMMCSGLSCTCPEGADCSAMPVRCGLDGGNVCPAVACDPAPMMVEGETVFGNMCVDSMEISCDVPEGICALASCDGSACAIDSCGTCGLGGFECALGQAPACVDAPLMGILDAAMVECDDTSLSSTFLYVDDVLGVDEADAGSRAKPFKTMLAAYGALATRSAEAIVVAGSPTITTLLDWERPVSILGGYTNIGGNFERDLSQRPVFSRLSIFGTTVGMTVRDLGSTPTVFHHIAIRARGVNSVGSAAASSSYGLIVVNSPGLVLDDVEVTARDALDGSDGTNGSNGRNGNNGGKATAGNGTANGSGGANLGCLGSVGGAGGDGGNGNAGQRGNNSSLGGTGGSGGAPAQPGGRGGNGGRPFPRLLVGASAQFEGAPDATSERWVFTSEATDGASGVDGAGGGGGGGAGGFNFGVSRLRGGAGGGGGAGGCGGTRGRAGTNGGASIGILAIASNGLTVRRGNIIVGDGGDGGSGGDGGDGGDGGNGGSGANGEFTVSGGRGGDGQDGQSGTRGGGGAGGPSFGIVCDGPTSASVDADTMITLGTAGTGGQSGTSTDRGADGLAVDNQDCN